METLAFAIWNILWIEPSWFRAQWVIAALPAVIWYVSHTLSYLLLGQLATRRRGWLRTWRCHIMWGSSSPKSSQAWIWKIWSAAWRMTTFQTSATTAGKRNSKVGLLLASGQAEAFATLEEVWQPSSYISHDLFVWSVAEEGMLYRARYFGDSELYQRAQRARTPSCAKLSEITASLH